MKTVLLIFEPHTKILMCSTQHFAVIQEQVNQILNCKNSIHVCCGKNAIYPPAKY